jgi:SpoU rRNA methylase family enzyme
MIETKKLVVIERSFDSVGYFLVKQDLGKVSKFAILLITYYLL